MMFSLKKRIKAFLFAHLCLLIGGCAFFSPIEFSLSSDPLPESTSAFSEELPGEPPVPDDYLNSPLPDFLDEEQRHLYLRAKTIYAAMKSDTTNIDGVPFDEDGSAAFPAQVFETDHGRYYISTGRYQKWEDFDAMMHAIFTDDCVRLLTGADGEFPVFFEKDGLLCYLDAARGSRWGYREPDEYQLTEKTESSISFDVIGHYESHTDESVIETEAFPVRMVRTEEGWRFDQFAAPMLEP